MNPQSCGWLLKCLDFVCKSFANYDKCNCTFSNIFPVVIMDCITKGWFPSFPGLHLCGDQPSKVLLSPNDVFVKWPIRAQLNCLDFWNLTWIICMALWCIIQIHCQQKSMKEEMRKKGNRWYKITVNVVNEEREWSGWIFFLFPHTFTLWYKLLCTPHRLRSWSAK